MANKVKPDAEGELRTSETTPDRGEASQVAEGPSSFLNPLEEEVFVPFGRYERDRPAPFPAHEVLVGREKERAKLLDLLFSVGPRGAYLITGHRGSGKTSFVDYCLREYKENLYGRFLQRNIGRSLFWDRLGLILLVAVLVATGLLLSEVLAEVLSEVPDASGRWTFPSVVAALVLTLLLSYPLFLAQETFRGAFPVHGARSDSLLRRIALPFFLLLVMFFLPRHSPEIMLAQLLLVGCHMFFLHTLLFWTRGSMDRDNESPVDSPVESIRPPDAWRGRVSVALIVLAMGLWPLYTRDLLLCLFLSFAALAAAMAVRLLPELLVKIEQRPRIAAALRSSARWQIAGVSSLLLVMCGIFFAKGASHVILAAASAVYFAVVLGTYVCFKGTFAHGGTQEPLRFHPQPRRLLLFKGFALTLIGVQFLDPLARLFRNETIIFINRHGWFGNLAVRPNSWLLSLSERLYALLAEWAAGLSEPWETAGFTTISSDLAWAVLALLILVVLFHIEYEWIVRPYSAAREDLSLHDTRPKPNSQRTKGFSAGRYQFREMLYATFFWKIYSLWLPLLTIRVNLGFHELDQRLVIEAMLTGLREEFGRLFLRWSGTFTAVRRLLGLLILAALALWAGDRWFGGMSAERPLSGPITCDEMSSNSDERWTPLWVSCRVGGDALLRTLRWAPFLGTPTERIVGSDQGPNTLQRLLGLRMAKDPRRQEIFDVRIYHLLTFLLLLMLTSLAARWWRPLPFRDIDERMTHVLDGLSSRLREESRPDRVSSWLNAIRGREMVEAKEGGPFDPRTVELHFLAILDDLQNSKFRLPFGTTKRVTLPLPEVIFIFDELDKIGVASRALAEDGDAGEIAREPLDQERERSRSLHQLFSDMKNVMSSGHARFLFVGGRNLHDEWLADSSARRPLLSNIFLSEIYIPSLLVDDVGAVDEIKFTNPKFAPGVEAFVRRQLFRAEVLHRLSSLRRVRPGFSLQVEEAHLPAFVQTPFSLGVEEPVALTKSWPGLRFHSSTAPRRPDVLWEASFGLRFMEFLTYRSKGNVKRLREILTGFVEPAGRVRVPPGERQLVGELCDCDHVLRFTDVDRFRVCLVAELFRSMLPELEPRIRLRDDKMSQAMLYLADFLLKFHRRAFSWSNIERVDELVHIHRAPDLRATMQRILGHWEDRYLHRIRNGMYNFRFNSEFSRELEYLSKASDEELAALNFTLDESHFLKAIYRSRCDVLGEKAGEDFTTGLAELHEFDEEYEVARHFLQRAVIALDRRFEASVGGNPFEETPSQHLISGTVEGREAGRTRLSYGVARLRVMLQIGMTFERSRDFENALIEYREARTLAQSLLEALLALPSGEEAKPTSKRSADDYIASLKHLHILFQPLFAEAWLAEKAVSGIDIGPGIVEAGLSRLREMLPFVSRGEFVKDSHLKTSLDIRHSNFALVLAELENKTGDLFFFKGRQLVSEDRVNTWTSSAKPRDRSGTEGYLMRALYHYGISLHELRRYTAYRKETSKDKFSYPIAEGGGWYTIESKVWPHSVLRAAAGYLADLNDSLIARFSFAGLLRAIDVACVASAGTSHAVNRKAVIKKAYDHFAIWLESSTVSLSRSQRVKSDREVWTDVCSKLFPSVHGIETGLNDWLGRPVKRDQAGPELLFADRNNTDLERLISSLLLSMVGARILAEGNYRHAAMRQYLRVVEAVSTFHWWWWSLRWVLDNGKASEHIKEIVNGVLSEDVSTRVAPFFADLRALAAHALRSADRICVDPARELPSIAPIIASSLFLAAEKGESSVSGRPESTLKDIGTVLERWLPASMLSTSQNGGGARVREDLVQRLRTHPYPLLVRLMTLKILIDDGVLAESAEPTLIGEWANLLVRLEQSYASPLHFTRLHSGVSLGLAALKLGDEQRALQETAVTHLNESREIYSMGRGYYQAISDMYYLYDDFNDRYVHANHALQMAGTEVATFFLRFLVPSEPG